MTFLDAPKNALWSLTERELSKVLVEGTKAHITGIVLKCDTTEDVIIINNGVATRHESGKVTEL